AGAKVACFTAHDLITKPKLLEKIKKEFGELSKERPYKSFLPEDAEPPLGWNAALMAKYKSEMENHYIKP
ncbi:amidohydrolase, partial [Chloroflexota bacterium]